MFIPFLAPGHMLPMVDIARLFAVNGVNVTILTTTTNARLISSAIDHDARSGLRISLITLTFPCQEAGLPEGCENLLSAPTPEINFKLFHGIKLLQPEMSKLIRTHHPDCLASDYLFPWSADVTSELGIPRLAFSGSGFFNLCIADSIESNNPHGGIESETEEFVVPGIPHLVKLTRSQLPDMVKRKTEFSGFFDILKKAERKSYGVLMNSFQGLESDYVDHFKKSIGLKAWQLGPVSLFINRINLDVENINRSDNLSNWLNSKKSNSVLYVCLGSLTRFSKNQISEIATALEELNYPFIWVFYNEKLVTQVLKFGVSVGNEVWSVWATEESPLIKAEKMKSAIDVVMGQGAEATKMREKVKILADMAKKAVEIGGSSDCDLKSLLNDLREYKRTRDNGLLNR
ncbi:Scopoletin glucosyltransferase [Linum grandiflorum]